ncbi:esterase/lipase family protein [Kibdelosporangium phytohabitans]|uniref:GPI inositol-deacylase PGAP1-like alpha/beta domain-containing protein n=1 Tax=Kibdelosporangium phytohabitans TaxID=860235 RepID=A0A0N7F4R3_9PSEU|nr:hypothetical protein [Kibdelosporangium phytohabitans]ALG12151.1 hypothetical protein AOZ06_39565 [Kibdelosporangium phytohabitans]MBE1463670.1 pimeloyl-ACP methyl ester carboxylesterase [Kibdelosporangium phytohabitans]
MLTFDYHDHSARWVDAPAIGPAVGDAIDCLFKATGEKVIVVAHSMGGLAARHALAQQADRSKEVSTVITFGTPAKGSLIAVLGDATLDAGAIANRVIGVVRLILATCGHAASDTLRTGTPCDLLPEPARAFDSQAGLALRYGSPQLAAPKPFPKNVKVHALAGDTVLTVAKAGWFRLPWEVDKVPVGDLVVMTDSATSGATGSRTASCAYQLNAVRAGTDQVGLTLGFTAENDVAQPITSALGACFHSDLMRTIQLTNDAGSNRTVVLCSAAGNHGTRLCTSTGPRIQCHKCRNQTSQSRGASNSTTDRNAGSGQEVPGPADPTISSVPTAAPPVTKSFSSLRGPQPT